MHTASVEYRGGVRVSNSVMLRFSRSIKELGLQFIIGVCSHYAMLAVLIKYVEPRHTAAVSVTPNLSNFHIGHMTVIEFQKCCCVPNFIKIGSHVRPPDAHNC